MPLPADLEQTTLATPVGELTLIASGHGLVAVLWPGEAPGPLVDRQLSLRDSATEPTAEVDGPSAILRTAVAQLSDYFAGGRTTFDLPVDLRGTPFQRAAWEVLRGIPFGTTISYGEQARRLGDRRKARAVGAANGRNPIPIVVPCHRVIGADGSLTGFAAGTDAKARLLRHEAAIAAALADRAPSTP